MKIDIMAYQFGFHIRNPGADGKLGAYDLGGSEERREQLRPGS